MSSRVGHPVPSGLLHHGLLANKLAAENGGGGSNRSSLDTVSVGHRSCSTDTIHDTVSDDSNHNNRSSRDTLATSTTNNIATAASSSNSLHDAASLDRSPSFALDMPPPAGSGSGRGSRTSRDGRTSYEQQLCSGRQHGDSGAGAGLLTALLKQEALSSSNGAAAPIKGGLSKAMMAGVGGAGGGGGGAASGSNPPFPFQQTTPTTPSSSIGIGLAQTSKLFSSFMSRSGSGSTPIGNSVATAAAPSVAIPILAGPRAPSHGRPPVSAATPPSSSLKAAQQQQQQQPSWRGGGSAASSLRGASPHSFVLSPSLEAEDLMNLLDSSWMGRDLSRAQACGSPVAEPASQDLLLTASLPDSVSPEAHTDAQSGIPVAGMGGGRKGPREGPLDHMSSGTVGTPPMPLHFTLAPMGFLSAAMRAESRTQTAIGAVTSLLRRGDLVSRADAAAAPAAAFPAAPAVSTAHAVSPWPSAAPVVSMPPPISHPNEPAPASPAPQESSYVVADETCLFSAFAAASREGMTAAGVTRAPLISSRTPSDSQLAAGAMSMPPRPIPSRLPTPSSFGGSPHVSLPASFPSAPIPMAARNASSSNKNLSRSGSGWGNPSGASGSQQSLWITCSPPSSASITASSPFQRLLASPGYSLLAAAERSTGSLPSSSHLLLQHVSEANITHSNSHQSLNLVSSSLQAGASTDSITSLSATPPRSGGLYQQHCRQVQQQQQGENTMRGGHPSTLSLDRSMASHSSGNLSESGHSYSAAEPNSPRGISVGGRSYSGRSFGGSLERSHGGSANFGSSGIFGSPHGGRSAGSSSSHLAGSLEASSSGADRWALQQRRGSREGSVRGGAGAHGSEAGTVTHPLTARSASSPSIIATSPYSTVVHVQHQQQQQQQVGAWVTHAHTAPAAAPSKSPLRTSSSTSNIAPEEALSRSPAQEALLGGSLSAPQSTASVSGPCSYPIYPNATSAATAAPASSSKHHTPRSSSFSQAQQAASPLLSPDTVLTSILEQEASGGLDEEDDEDQEAEASSEVMGSSRADTPQSLHPSPPSPAAAPRPPQEHNPAALASHVLQPRLGAYPAPLLPPPQQYSKTASDALAAAAVSVAAAEAAGRLLRFSRGGSSASTPRSSFDLNPLRRISSEGGKMHSLSAHPAYACSTSESGVCSETVGAVAEALSVPVRREHHAAAAAAQEGEALAAAEDSASDTSSQLVLHRLVAGAHMIPHVDKVEKGGEDAFFISPSGYGGIGVADGVSGWADEGIDPAEYPRTLMAHTQEAYEASDGQISSRDVIRYSQNLTTMPGSSTVTLAFMREGGLLEVANVGDSGVRLLRRGRVVYASEPQQHAFNMPFQLSHPINVPGPDNADDADVAHLATQPGDVILLATDGLYDNLFDEEIEEIACTFLAGAARHLWGGAVREAHGPEDAKALARALCERAHEHARNPLRRTPWSVTACAQTNFLWARMFTKGGGKMDDCTVLIAFVAAAAPAAPTPAAGCRQQQQQSGGAQRRRQPHQWVHQHRPHAADRALIAQSWSPMASDSSCGQPDWLYGAEAYPTNEGSFSLPSSWSCIAQPCKASPDIALDLHHQDSGHRDSYACMHHPLPAWAVHHSNTSQTSMTSLGSCSSTTIAEAGTAPSLPPQPRSVLAGSNLSSGFCGVTGGGPRHSSDGSCGDGGEDGCSYAVGMDEEAPCPSSELGGMRR
ncbi:MAG: hypothetical protein WDW38_000362 [Sanguina aurantia]